MSMLDLVLVILGSATAGAFLIAILILTVGGPAIYLREFVRSVFQQTPPASPTGPSAELTG